MKFFYKKRNTLVSDSDIFVLQHKLHFKQVIKKKNHIFNDHHLPMDVA